MDVKPQRPLRALRVLTDENFATELPLPKTIHQRNKSSPALTMAAGMKAAAKRTAFGDVSNIVAGKRSSKDDSSVSSKSSQVPVKLQPSLQERKSTTFLRPAQRPLSVTGIKGLLTNPSNPESFAKVPLNDVSTHSHSSHSSNVRKPLARKSTTVFRDEKIEILQEDETAMKKLPPAPTNEVQGALIPALSGVDPTQPDSRFHLPPPVTVDTLEPVKLAPPLASVSSLSDVNQVYSITHQVSLEVEHKPIIQDTILEVEEPPSANGGRTQYLDALPEIPASIDVVEPQSVLPVAAAHPLEEHLDMPAPRPTPLDTNNEYWEDDYEEGYDEDGYVTARSFRSRGDNTTGSATTVLFPQFNLKARKEVSDAKRLVEATRSPEEIEDEAYDTSMVAEYGEEIFDYMKQQEIRLMPNAHYMDNQHEIQWSMRAVLMDWLVQVHHRFNLLPETLFLTVNYVDRFLSCKVVSLGKLQLVGATAIFIAAKYEEINCPSVQEIVYMVDNGYSIDEILKAERFMLTMLQFELGWPGPMSFLRRISKADDYDLETRTLAKYFLEVTLMDERFIGSPPSFTAAASHCLARLMLRKGTWSPHHIFYSGYTFSQLKPLVQLLLECCEDPRKHHQAVFNKYYDKRYKRASHFVEEEVRRGYCLPDAIQYKPVTQYHFQAYQQMSACYA